MPQSALQNTQTGQKWRGCSPRLTVFSVVIRFFCVPGNIDQAQYCERIKGIIELLGSKLSLDELSKIWKIQVRDRKSSTRAHITAVTTQSHLHCYIIKHVIVKLNSLHIFYMLNFFWLNLYVSGRPVINCDRKHSYNHCCCCCEVQLRSTHPPLCPHTEGQCCPCDIWGNGLSSWKLDWKSMCGINNNLFFFLHVV